MRLILPLICVLPMAAHSEQLRVVTDIAPIHSLVAQVMNGVGTPDVLVSGAASPHDFQFTFAQAQSVQDADLVIWAGDGLTPWLHDSLETLADGTSQIALLEVDGWPKLELRSEADFESFGEAHDHDDHGDDGDHDDHDDHDEAYGGDHNTDPHAWLDPAVAHAWLGLIANALIEADPDKAAQYQENLVTAQSDMDALSAEITATLSDVAAAPFLVPHDAYQYFGARFGHPASAAIALSDASAPTPDKIIELKDIVATTGVVCVLSDPQARSEWSDLIREGADTRTAVADPLGADFELGPDHYGQTLRAIAAAYADCIGG